jgi:nucleotide-binding universal stress UspA family protein
MRQTHRLARVQGSRTVPEETPMTYATLLVHLDVGESNQAALQVAADLAQRFNARVIGVAACQPLQLVYTETYMSADVLEQDRAEIERETGIAEAAFHAAMHGCAAPTEWRAELGFLPLAEFIATQARAADLVITGPQRGGGLTDTQRRTTISDLVMQAGRPVLVVPQGLERLDIASAVVGWKDTRESRRAIMDSLPLLRRAGRVAVVQVAPHDDIDATRHGLADVCAWLRSHLVTAEPVAMTGTGDDATALHTVVTERAAGLLVAGAYGHNRLEEWVMGGVTRDLLLRPERCTLMAH